MNSRNISTTNDNIEKSNTDTQPAGKSAAQPPLPGESRSLGAPPSNTAPCNSQDDHFVKILRTGIDSLYLSYPGSLHTETAVRLDEFKKLAQSDDLERSALAQFELEGHLFHVNDKGTRNFRYILADNWYRIEVASLVAKSLPLAYARIASELLTLQGPQFAEKELRSIVSRLGQLEGSANVSRVDLCVDFITSYPLDEIKEDDWVSRAKVLDRFSVNRAFSGWVIGPGGLISARLYNKTLELEKSGKTYNQPEWEKAGWKPGQTVWRLEFQLRRSVLKELDISTFGDLIPNCGGLWRYATASWLRLSQSDGARTSRKSLITHPLWDALAVAEWDDVGTCARCPVEKRRIPSDARLFINGLSSITSFMAREGIFSPDDGIRGFWQAAIAFHNTRSDDGLGFAEYVYKKTLEKCRAYNTVKTHEAADAPDPGQSAVARAYRQRSDG